MASLQLLTDREQLASLFDELTAELQRLAVRAEIVMVGGAWMLWHSRRAATRDVDSARRFEQSLNEAIDVVGSRHGLMKGWLNDAAAAYWPAGASLDDGDVVYQSDSLRVRTPAAEVVFVMMLYRAHPQDREDMVSLWPMCRFATAQEAVDAFRHAYPHALDDEHLITYILDIAHDADLA